MYVQINQELVDTLKINVFISKHTHIHQNYLHTRTHMHEQVCAQIFHAHIHTNTCGGAHLSGTRRERFEKKVLTSKNKTSKNV
jgi:hypothetical protein